MKQSRKHAYRQILTAAIARDAGGGGGTRSATPTAWVTGGHSLLRFAIAVIFFPDQGPPASFAGNTFNIYPWVEEPDGKRARSSTVPINGTTALNAPEMWEGASTIDEYEIQATLAAVGKVGEWRAFVIVEPVDGAALDLFDELAARVQVRAESAPVTMG